MPAGVGAGNAAAQPQQPRENEKVWVGVRLKPIVQEPQAAQAQAQAQAGHDAAAAGEREESVWSTCAIDNRTLRYAGPVVDGGQGHHQSQQTAWRFDRVFGCRASNEIVFKEAALPLVDSAMRGVNGTVFAYGQTASGKTYTISSIVRQSARRIPARRVSALCVVVGFVAWGCRGKRGRSRILVSIVRTGSEERDRDRDQQSGRCG